MTSQPVGRWLSAAVVAGTLIVPVGLSTLTGCRPGMPVAEPDAKPGRSAGTISGRVRAPQGRVPIEGRLVEAIDVGTGERLSGTTSVTGGFTLKLKPGTYRFQLALRPGESLTKEPGIIDVSKSDPRARADFVIAVLPIARPSDPAKTSGATLGPPIA
jgi:hypothetical protein